MDHYSRRSDLLDKFVSILTSSVMEVYPKHCDLPMGHNTQTDRCDLHMRHFMYPVENAYIPMALRSTTLNALQCICYFNFLAKILIDYFKY
jgi:hypothetical protein